MKKTLLLYLFILCSFISANSQIIKPVKWSHQINKLSDNEVMLIFTAEIESGWHLYAQDFANGGPIPLKFNFEKSEHYNTIGKAIESPKAHEEFDDIFGINVRYFKESKIKFKQKIKILSNKPFTIQLEIEAQACQDDGQCVLAGQDFEIKLEGTNNPIPTSDTISEIKKEPNDTILNQTKNTDTITEQNTETIQKNENPPKKLSINPMDPNILTGDKSLLMIFFLAFGAGLLGLLTPCIFPMIPMTISFFLKDDKSKRKGRIQAIFYGISIVAIYTIPVLVLYLFAILFNQQGVTDDFFNWVSTHWFPNILFFLIFMIFAASFLGMFEIVLPSWMVNKADAKAEKGGLAGAFFMALVLVLVSFSCTGPIVASVIFQASRGGALVAPVVAILGFSLAFAIPFTLFAFFPEWLKKLPKSGGWLNSVKVILGFIEIALGLKFLSVADQTYHWGILDREVYIAIWIVVFSLMGLYLLGKLKFSHDSDLKFVSVPRLALAIVSFAFVVYLIPGMFGAPLKVLSGYLPPQSTHDFDMRQIVREVVKEYSIGSTGTSKSNCGKGKYSDILHLPHGIEGYYDYEEGLACAKKLNKPIFIDFTGHGCVNCREMEARVWSNPTVLQKMKDDYVVIALYVDDKTTLPETDWGYTKEGKPLKTIGKKYADFQSTKFNINSQPYYVLLDTNGNLLTQPRTYDLNIDKFILFLEDGLTEFKKRTE